jgi:NADH-quinone oxidoreductase subunit M
LAVLPQLQRKPLTYTFRIGIAGVIYGSIVALRKDLKKLLAYSSLAHVGLIAASAYTLRLTVCVVLFCK